MSNATDVTDDSEFYWEIPDELVFYYPSNYSIAWERWGADETPVTLNFDDDKKLYRQLICWTLIQNFWYFVEASPKVTDLLFDRIQKYIVDMEGDASYLRSRYSPTLFIGASQRTWYPYSIQLAFYKGKIAA